MTGDGILRVGVDGFPLSGQRSGIGRYVAELLMSAAMSDPQRVQFSVALCRLRRRRPEPDLDDLRSAGLALRRPWRSLWETVDRVNRFGLPLPFDVLVPGRDVHFFTRYVHYSTRRPVLSMVYDLAYRQVPGTVRPDYLPHLRRTATRAIERSELVGVISEALADELAAAYPGVAGRIVILRPGPTTALQGSPPPDWRERLSRRGLTPGYMLHVGTLEPRKNLVRLVQARKLLAPADRRDLVLVGANGWGTDDLHREIGADPSIIHVAYVDDRDLRSLYAGAALFVFPTMYEGFGVPVLEALSLGVPVACSNLPVMREVAGPAAAYFDEADPDSIAATLSGLFRQPEQLEASAQAGLARAGEFSWSATSGLFLGRLRELATSR